MRLRPLILIGCAAAVLAADGAGAQQQPNDRPGRAEVWDLKLGTPADRLPADFTDYACGNNGGPPSTPLNGWRDFRRCRPDGSGLREVYFRYDDELEY